MERGLALKLIAMVVLAAFLMLALSSIRSLVAERQARRDGAVQDIARSSSGEQQLAGPVLIVPYRRVISDLNHDGRHYLEERAVAGELRFLPESLDIDGNMPTERRARGIYEVRIYRADLHVTARFKVPAHYGVTEDLAHYTFERPLLVMGVTDTRGIGNASKAMVNGQPLQLLPGSGVNLLSVGAHAQLPPVDADNPGELQVAIDFSLLGTSQLRIVPVGRQTRVRLGSNWASPGFVGDFLPVQYKVDARGFSAQWSTSFFATNLEEVIAKCHEKSYCPDFAGRQFGVSLVDPVDQYLKTERAIKYALLFILLPFAVFSVFDLLKRLRVHPIQYGLVGTALALFYLLLLSLSEHVGFGAAYVLSAGACAGLIGFYVSQVLRSAAWGIGFAGGLGILYACLFGVLSAEDFALLMGSLLLFAVLAAVMVLTRRVDWFSVGLKEE